MYSTQGRNLTVTFVDQNVHCFRKVHRRCIRVVRGHQNGAVFGDNIICKWSIFTYLVCPPLSVISQTLNGNSTPRGARVQCMMSAISTWYMRLDSHALVVKHHSNITHVWLWVSPVCIAHLVMLEKKMWFDAVTLFEMYLVYPLGVIVIMSMVFSPSSNGLFVCVNDLPILGTRQTPTKGL